MRYLIFVLLVSSLFSCSQQHKNTINLSSSPEANELLNSFISSITFDSLGSLEPKINVLRKDDAVFVELIYDITDTIKQNDWKVTIKPSFDATWHWQPHLTPTDNHIVAQHVFRSPALIMQDDAKQITVIPNTDNIKNGDPEQYMDLDARSDVMTLGVSNSNVTSHVLFEKAPGQIFKPGKFKFSFYIFTTTDKSILNDPWRTALDHHWKRSGGGEQLYNAGQPIKGDMEPYVKHTYNWAFDTWKKSVLQEFTINGKKVGAPVFIVNITQSPNYPGLVNEREFRSIWNQAWFSSLRSASGLYRYARRTNNNELLAKANMTKELALSFPQTNGLFPSVIGTEMEQVEIDGKKYKRSKGWDHRYFGNSNRNPSEAWGGAKTAPYHILDMSWTASLMLTWDEELEHDQRLVDYAKRYADKLITLQDTIGFFPGWLEQETFKQLPVMNETPETSMSATFLLKMYQRTKDEKYLTSATKAINAVTDHIVPNGQWEDFETYWSCSSVLDTLVGRKIERNNAFKQNTLSMFWTAEALFNFYKQTGDKNYLSVGQRVLDELLMYQASWQPSFIPIPALGGFGVMNADGEWNDSRQCLFAELIIRYGKELNHDAYVHRGIAALKASFVMMYCPENPETKAQWEKVYPFFNEKDYGFMMENYGHGGKTNSEGLGIGEFTIYDWGNGAAAEAYNTILDRFGSEIIR